MVTVQVFPEPKEFKLLGGSGRLSSDFHLQCPEEMGAMIRRVSLRSRLKALCDGEHSKDKTPIRLRQDRNLASQGYRLVWNKQGLLIECAQAAGLFYALVTLRQLSLAYQGELPYVQIADEPDFPVRGFLLDIGRNKIPTLETLYALVDLMAEVKLNHLQLYMEGYAFEYEKHKHLFPDATPFTAEEFRKLDRYAKERFIDLVPNQNCLGHMGDWLATAELADLAEHPGGITTPFQFAVPPVTLNPIDSRSSKLVEDLFEELLPNFSSPHVNVNMDEPFGLGKGQSAGRGKPEELYLQFARKIFAITAKHGKKPLMWGDFVLNHPDLLPVLPGEVTVLLWNYDSNISFESSSRLLHEKQVPFYVCPGTSSWSSISLRTDNMLGNIRDAALCGKKFGASGLIVTDWGDDGHWQVLPMSLPGLLYGAGLGWQVGAHIDSEDKVAAYLTERVFWDEGGEIGSFLFELGRYAQYEGSNFDNSTYLSKLLNFGHGTSEAFAERMEIRQRVFQTIGIDLEPFQLQYDEVGMNEWLTARKEQLGKVKLKSPAGGITEAELANTLRIIEQGAGLHRLISKANRMSPQAERELVLELKTQLATIIREFDRLWLARNKAGGLEKSNRAFYQLLEQYEQELERGGDSDE